jgi:hypothetical protein
VRNLIVAVDGSFLKPLTITLPSSSKDYQAAALRVCLPLAHCGLPLASLTACWLLPSDKRSGDESAARGRSADRVDVD